MENIAPLFADHGVYGLALLALLIGYGFLVRSLKDDNSTAKLISFATLGTISILVLFLFGAPKDDVPTSKRNEIVTIEKANNLMERLDRAISRKDIDGAISLLSADAVIEISNLESKKKVFSRSDYKAYLSNAFNIPSKYQLESISDEAFLVKGGEQVVVTTLSFEKINLGPFYEGVLSQQVAIVESIDGLPKIVAVMASQVRRITSLGKGVPDGVILHK